MAKKEMDDWDLDDDLGFGDDDFGFGDDSEVAPQSSRDAVMSAPKVAAKAAAENIISPANRKKLILKSLPTDFTVASNAYDNLATTGSEVFREAKTSLNQTKRELQRTAQSALPMVKKYLPDRITSKVEKWSQSDEYDYSSPSPEEQRENQLTAMLDQTLPDPAELKKEQHQNDVDAVADDIQKNADNIRKDNMNQMVSKIGEGIATLVGYNQLTDKYRRKMLEVNWRQFYALTDMLTLQRENSEKINPAIEAIVKNTALPDYAKEEFGEISAALMKRKVINYFSPGKFANEYMSELGNNAKRAINDFTQSIKGNISMAGEMVNAANQMGDDGGMGGELTPDQENAKNIQSAASLLGDQLSEKYINPWLGKMAGKVRDRLDENDDVVTAGSKMRYYLSNIADVANGADITQFVPGRLGQVLQSILPQARENTASLDTMDMDMLSKVAPWTTRNDITLNEVIPGWLSRIYGVMNSAFGDGGGSPVFNYRNAAFEDGADVHTEIRKAVEGTEESIDLKEQISRLIDDMEGSKDLSDAGRTELGRYLEGFVRSNKLFDIKKVHEGDLGLNANDAIGGQEASDFLSNYAGHDDLGRFKVNNEIMDSVRFMRDRIGSAQERMDEALNLYGRDAIINSGSMQKSGGRFTLNDRAYTSYSSDDPEKAKVREAVQGMANVVKDHDTQPNVRTALNDLNGGLGNIGGKFTEGLNGVGDKVTNGFSGVGNTFSEGFANSSQVLNSGFASNTQALNDGFGDVSSSFDTGLNNVNESIGSGFNDVKTSFSTGLDDVKSSFSNDLDGVNKTINDSMSGVGNSLDKNVKAINRNLNNGFKNVTTSFDKGLGKLDRTFNDGMYRNGRTIKRAIANLKKSLVMPDPTDSFREVLMGKGSTSDSFVDALRAMNAEKEKGKSDIEDDIVNKIYEQLKENNLKAEVDDIIDMITILATNGFPSYTISVDAGSLKEQAARFASWTKNKSTSAYGFAKRKAADFADTISGFTSRISDKFRAFDDKFDPFTKAKNFGDGIVSQTKAFYKSAKQSIEDTVDIRDADGNIVLLGRKLKAGQYFDSAGNVIRSIKDIKGAVYDELGNVVLTEEEVKKKADEFTYYAKQGMGRFSELLGKGLGAVIHKGGLVSATVQDQIRRIGKWAYNHVMTDGDIYVKGESKPRLRRELMLQNFYIDFNTKKYVHEAKDITGDVYDKYKRLIISAEEMAAEGFELVDVDGSPFKTMLQKATSRLSRAKDMGVKAATAIRDKLKDLASGAMNLVKSAGSWLAGKSPLAVMTKEAQKPVVERLDKIYDLLAKHFGTEAESDTESMKEAIREGMGEAREDATEAEEKKESKAAKAKAKEERKAKAKAKADTDGDGVRDGSWRDQIAKRLKWRKSRKGKTAAGQSDKHDDSEDKSGLGGLLLTALGFVASKGMGLFSKIGFGIAKSFATNALSWLTTGLKNMLGKGGLVRTAISGAGRLAGSAAMAVGRGAITMASAAGSAVWGAVGSTVTGLASAAGSFIMGALGTLSAPVVLGGLALAAVGYLAYRLITDKDCGPMTQVRLAMYGTRDYDDGNADEVEKLLALEGILSKHLTFDDKGIATISNVDDKETLKLAEPFEVDPTNEGEVKAFQRWLYGRYIPVYLLWATRLKQMAPSIPLEKLDSTEKLTSREKVKLLGNVKLPKDHPVFSILESPFAIHGMFDTMGSWFSDTSLLNGSEVENVFTEKLAELAKLAKEEPVKEKVTESNWYDATATDLKVNKDGSVVAGGHKFASVKEFETAAAAAKKRAAITKPSRTTTRIDGGGTDQRNPATTNALENIRLKAYGLPTLEIDKIATLFELEADVMKYVKTSKGSATVEVDDNEMAEEWMGDFGLKYNNEEERTRWITWFRHRFCNVLTAFVAHCRDAYSNANPLTIILGQQSAPKLIKVANALIKLQVSFGGNLVSVWSLDYSPFAGLLHLNTDSSSTAGNVQFIRDLIKEAKATDQTGKKPDLKIVDKDGELRKPKSVKPKERKRPAVIDALLADSPDLQAKMPKDPGSGDYAKLSNSDNGRDSIGKLLKDVAKVTGANSADLLAAAMTVSNMRPTVNQGTNLPQGLFGFTPEEWSTYLVKYGNDYGVPSTASPTDPKANAILGALRLKDAKESTGGDFTQALLRTLAGKEASSYVTEMNASPDGDPAENFADVVSNYPNIFTSSGRTLSFKEVAEQLSNLIQNRYSYVSKYSDDKPTFEVKSGLIGKPADRERITGLKASRDVDKIVSKSIALRGAPATYSQVAEAKEDRKTSKAIVESQRRVSAAEKDGVDPEKYMGALRQELDRRLALQPDRTKENIGDYSGTSISLDATNNILSDQLDVLYDIAMSLRHMEEKTEFAGNDADRVILEQRQANENKQRPNYKAVHANGPINTKRKRAV